MQARQIFWNGAERTELKRTDNSPQENRKRGYRTMSVNEITSKAREIRELEALIAEAQAQAEALKDQIKAYMGDSEQLQAGEYKISWKTVTTTRIDTAAIKKLFSTEDLEGYTKTTTVRRFSIA